MDADEYYKNGQAKVKQNQLDEAIELFTKAIELSKENPFYYNERSICYLNREQFDLALFDMNKSVEIDPNYAYFYSTRAFLKIRMKDMDGGIADYEMSLELDPDNDITYNNLGMALEQMGNTKKAERVYAEGNKVLGYDPSKRPIEEPEEDTTDVPTPPSSTLTNDKTKKQLAKEVFSRKSTFKEFMGFIGNGFKLKKND